MRSDESGLVRVHEGKVAPEHEAKVACHPYQGRLRRLVQEASEFEADYVYFRLYPETGAPRAEVFIFDRTKPTAAPLDEAERRLQLWNYGQVPLMFVLRREGVHIHNLLTKPELDGEGRPQLGVFEQLILAADAVAEIDQSKWNRFNAHRFDNGTFWEGNPLLKDAETSVKALVNEVRNARLEVERHTADWSDPTLAKRLMIFVIMVKFLEERGILTEDYFRKANVDATRFENIVGIPGLLARVLGKLEDDLNGDVFRLRNGSTGGPSERDRILELKPEQLAPIARFATGRTSNGQMHLWKLYRFDHLPVEAMSYIYEDFLGGEENAYYTPQLLAELLLDEAMEPERLVTALQDWEPGNAAPYRLIDPSCGSGVFLVGAWRRLVEAWRVLHPGEKPGIEVLSALMKQNVFGVDIKQDAIDLTCFSLSVALCAELMRDAKGDHESVLNDLQIHKLPSLKAGEHGNNLFAKDFFEQIESGLPHAGAFSLVIGNPPFKRELTSFAKVVASDKSKLTLGDQEWPSGVPGNQICFLFLRESIRLAKTGGLVCMVQKDSFLHSIQTQSFRAALFQSCRVPQVLDFISVRHLFQSSKSGGGTVDTKVVAVFVESTPATEKDVITHVTFRKSNSAESGLFFEVDAYDIHRIPVHLATSEPQLWKSNLLGGGRLLQTYHSVKAGRTLKEFLKSKKCVSRRPGKVQKNRDTDAEPLPDLWICTEGFQANNGVHRRPLRLNMKCISGDAFEVPTTQNPETYDNQDEWFEYPKDFAVFCPPHLIIREHEDLPSIFRTSNAGTPLLFKHNFLGIRCPLSDEGDLAQLASYFKSERVGLAFFLAFGAQGLLNRSGIPMMADILNLPYPEDGKLNFRGVEPALRDDVLNHMIPLIKYGTGKEETLHLSNPASQPQLHAFSSTLIQVLRNTWRQIREAKVADLGTAWCVAYSLDSSDVAMPDEPPAQLIARIDRLLEHRASDRLRFRRVVRVFDGNLFYLIKPKDYRYWLRSVAVRDADEVVGHLMTQAVAQTSKASARA